MLSLTSWLALKDSEGVGFVGVGSYDELGFAVSMVERRKVWGFIAIT